MSSVRSVFLTTAVALVALSAVPAVATPQSQTANYMPVGGHVPAPTGFLELCVRSPVDCQAQPDVSFDHIVGLARTALIEKRQSTIRTAKVDGHANAPVQAEAAPVVAAIADSAHQAEYVRVNLDASNMALVVGINDRVNHAIRAETDQQIYHVADYWVAPGIQPGARGDCEDFALEKRRLLIESGIAPASLSIAIVRTPAGEAHAVLVVSARQGDYVLDNLQPDVKAWQMTDYSWISRQGPGNDLNWVSLAPANTPKTEKVATAR